MIAHAIPKNKPPVNNPIQKDKHFIQPKAECIHVFNSLTLLDVLKCINEKNLSNTNCIGSNSVINQDNKITLIIIHMFYNQV